MKVNICSWRDWSVRMWLHSKPPITYIQKKSSNLYIIQFQSGKSNGCWRGPLSVWYFFRIVAPKHFWIENVMLDWGKIGVAFDFHRVECLFVCNSRVIQFWVYSCCGGIILAGFITRFEIVEVSRFWCTIWIRERNSFDVFSNVEILLYALVCVRWNFE